MKYALEYIQHIILSECSDFIAFLLNGALNKKIGTPSNAAVKIELEHRTMLFIAVDCDPCLTIAR